MQTRQPLRNLIISQRQFIIVGLVIGVAAVALLVTLNSRSLQKAPSVPSPWTSWFTYEEGGVDGTGGVENETAAAIRERATDQLVARLNQLPNAAAPGKTFYNNLAIQIPEPTAELIVTITGVENALDQDTMEPRSRTDFVLVARWREGTWVMRHYRERLHDLVHLTTTESEKEFGHPVPPAIAAFLGIDTGAR
jgi:hypothetical protein